jgi:hypothetical protein
VACAIAVLLHLFFDRTLLGKAMRAVALDREAARLMGIDVRRIVMLSFALGAAVGAVGGIIITPVTLTIYDAGTMLGIKGFAAAVTGGIGNTFGGIAGGLALGLLEAFGGGLIGWRSGRRHSSPVLPAPAGDFSRGEGERCEAHRSTRPRRARMETHASRRQNHTLGARWLPALAPGSSAQGARSSFSSTSPTPPCRLPDPRAPVCSLRGRPTGSGSVAGASVHAHDAPASPRRPCWAADRAGPGRCDGGDGNRSDIGLSLVPTVQRAEVPLMSVSGATGLVEPVRDRAWVFKSTVNDVEVVARLLDFFKKRGIKDAAMLATPGRSA